MSEQITTDSIIDAIALIELQRQEMHRESDPEGWRNRALATLRELLRQLEEKQRLHGPSAEYFASAEAVTTAIARVESRAGPASKRSMRKKEAGRHDGSRREARGRAPDQGKRGKSGRRGR